MVAVTQRDMAMVARMHKELDMLANDPPHGVCAWPVDNRVTELEAQIQGPEETPYQAGTFKIAITISERYPFEPPTVRFVTPIFHPNIDSAGRICLDTLKMRPQGSWLPSINLSTLLCTIRQLLAHPNADDGLMPEIAELFKVNRAEFNQRAAECTGKFASSSQKSDIVLPTIDISKKNKAVEEQVDDDEEEEDDEEGDDDDDGGDDDEEGGDDDEEGGEDDDGGDDDDDEDDDDFNAGEDDDDDGEGDDDDDDGGDDDDDDGGDDDDDDEGGDDDDDAEEEDEEEDEEEESRPKKKSKKEDDEEEEEEDNDDEE